MFSANLDRNSPTQQEPYPSEKSRVGELLHCIEVLSTLRMLCDEQITRVENQQHEDLQSLFPDPSTVTSTTSQWSDFSMRDLENRKHYLVGELRPWISQNLNMLEEMRTSFAAQ